MILTLKNTLCFLRTLLVGNILYHVLNLYRFVRLKLPWITLPLTLSGAFGLGSPDHWHADCGTRESCSGKTTLLQN